MFKRVIAWFKGYDRNAEFVKAFNLGLVVHRSYVTKAQRFNEPILNLQAQNIQEAEALIRDALAFESTVMQPDTVDYDLLARVVYLGSNTLH